MNGSGSAGIMASDNGFARHDSASAICTLAGGATDTAGAHVMRAASPSTWQVLTAVSAHLRKSFTAAEPALLQIFLVKLESNSDINGIDFLTVLIS